MMKSPKFWVKPTPTVLAKLLFPLSALYQKLHNRRLTKGIPHRANLPVLCVGNVTVGGTGKTPLCIALAKYLQEQGKRVIFLSRGYGGKLKGPVQVNPEKHTYKDVGDEPLLLAQVAPTIIAKDRHQGLAIASYLGGDIIIMDDGLQNPSVHRDKSVLVIDGNVGLGNGMTVPSGPMREPLSQALSRVNAVVIMGGDSHGLEKMITENSPHMPVVHAGVYASCKVPVGGAVVAFAGIGRPQKFFETVQALGYEIRKKIFYADHHPYTVGDMKKLQNLADRHTAKLLTTDKDKMRLSPELQNTVHVVNIEIRWQQDSDIQVLLGDWG